LDRSGIDALLTLFDNGLQLSFVRQPNVVIFYPLSSLIYCASIRFTLVDGDASSGIGWRFLPLDRVAPNRHPPLFCAVVRRTQIVNGDECHCFITKNEQAALALVSHIAQIYDRLPDPIRLLRSPMFYQVSLVRLVSPRCTIIVVGSFWT
jgi:hypothetical protein